MKIEISIPNSSSWNLHARGARRRTCAAVAVSRDTMQMRRPSSGPPSLILLLSRLIPLSQIHSSPPATKPEPAAPPAPSTTAGSLATRTQLPAPPLNSSSAALASSPDPALPSPSTRLYWKIKYISRLEYLWVDIRKGEVEIPEFVIEHDKVLEHRPLTDYGIEPDPLHLADVPAVGYSLGRHEDNWTPEDRWYSRNYM